MKTNAIIKLSEDLKSLLDSSIVDGEISSKERKVLLKRAISEGHDQDEFELHIDSLLFSKNGSFLKMIARSGNGDGLVNAPRSIHLAKNNKIYVSDTGRHRIQVFDRNGTFIK